MTTASFVVVRAARTARTPIGGLSVIDAPLREVVLKWAAKIAVACRCAQEVREFMPEPAVGT